MGKMIDFGFTGRCQKCETLITYTVVDNQLVANTDVILDARGYLYGPRRDEDDKVEWHCYGRHTENGRRVEYHTVVFATHLYDGTDIDSLVRGVDYDR